MGGLHEPAQPLEGAGKLGAALLGPHSSFTVLLGDAVESCPPGCSLGAPAKQKKPDTKVYCLCESYGQPQSPAED